MTKNKYNIGQKLYVYKKTFVLDHPTIDTTTVESIRVHNDKILYNNTYLEDELYETLDELVLFALNHSSQILKTYQERIDMLVEELKNGKNRNL